MREEEAHMKVETQKALWISSAFRSLLKAEREEALFRLMGNLFQVRAAAIGKARAPTVFRREDGISRSSWEAERRMLREGLQDTG